ncbi:MAG: prephenate dehydratase domain-containing protein [Candidatus Dojkabacteria bacterium]|nr:prephenate dehydratase domain-containing protein [Candidatus Dojkabacteria bacterium]MDQ7021392.1 prephenate dehydratase domain-containing protein [Candidatus Dojkabacteria bacterium]
MKTVYYLGPKQSYSGIISSKCFDSNDYNLEPSDNFNEIVKRCITNSNTIGVLPIENSITSTVHVNIDFMFKKELRIVGEANMDIVLNLIVLEGAEIKDIKEVYSHPKAIAQCSEMINERGYGVNESKSTAAGAEDILKLKDKTKACIGSAELAKKKGLKILIENIGNYSNNVTRFIFVSNNVFEVEESAKDYKKISVIYRVSHSAGSLANLLTSIGGIGISLTKIESRPIPDTNWEYAFWIDMLVDSSTEIGLKTILDKCTIEYSIIGRYRNKLNK